MVLALRAWRRVSTGSNLAMSNHLKHASRASQQTNFPWYLRVIFIVPGAIAFAVGWVARMQGILWFKGFSEKYGRTTYTPTAD